MMNTGKTQPSTYGELVTRLSRKLDSTAPHEEVSPLLQELKALLDASVRELSASAKIASHPKETQKDPTVRSVVSAGVEKYGTPLEPEQLRKEVEALRMRMVGVLVMGTSERLPSPEEEWPHMQSTTITTESGMSYGTVSGYSTLLMPTLETQLQINQFGHEMLAVYDYAIKTKGLIVDCSAVRRLPSFCQAILLGYRHSLSSLGKDFSVVWLHRSALATSDPASTARAFRGEFLGEYLFSKRE